MLAHFALVHGSLDVMLYLTTQNVIPLDRVLQRPSISFVYDFSLVSNQKQQAAKAVDERTSASRKTKP